MAAVRVVSAFNFLQPQDWDWQVTENTATSLVIQDAAAGKKQTFSGSFTYDSLGNVDGTCTSTSFFENGSLVYRVTGMNHDAGALQAFAAASGDTQETYAFVLSGNDVITGSASADTLAGYGGNDKINGGAGGDVMLGGAGNDVYIVDNVRDKTFETTTRTSGVDSGGTDSVFASVSHRLADFVEKLSLTGSASIDGTGNALNNTILGNGGANALLGGAGNDVLTGGGGADVLCGGSGRDTMTGGLGADVFDFDAAGDSGLAPTTWDILKDFTRAEDIIDLSGIDANGALDGNGTFTFSGLGRASVWGDDATGKLRYEVRTEGIALYGSTDADLDAEFAIFVTGVNALSASDLVL